MRPLLSRTLNSVGSDSCTDTLIGGAERLQSFRLLVAMVAIPHPNIRSDCEIRLRDRENSQIIIDKGKVRGHKGRRGFRTSTVYIKSANSWRSKRAAPSIATPCIRTIHNMPDAKLLAFAGLLGVVSLYLLFKSRRSRTRDETSTKTEKSQDHEVRRRAKLAKRAAQVEKACKKLDAQFFKEVEEIKVLAKECQEQILQAAEDGWKVKLKTGRDS